ncbi:MAG: peptidylprolyl isomerase [Flavobacteriaceae bacterium]|nr:peptidylprolyl isomerase [Flavobacteriaceae bacterium]
MMPSKIKNSKYISKLFFLVLVLFFNLNVISQSNSARIKVDGVASVVGDFVILDSDIDRMFVEMESQGISTKDVSRCELISKLMEDKLYAHHAIQDSLEVSDQEIYDYVGQSIDYFTEQLGSIEKVLEFYNKPDEASFRDELFEINKIQKLSANMQSEIVDKISITPEEVREFFESIPNYDLPVFGTELEISQIVISPKVSKEEENRIINQLRSFKVDILERGSSFASKAILYSQDPGSRSNGGKYTLQRKKPRMVKEFRDVGFRLPEGEISDPFKSDYGWHILKVDNIRGQEVDVRHILLTPRIDDKDLAESRKVLDTLRKRIIDEEISFKDAAIYFSSEKETKNNGGVLINPITGDTRFELTKIDPVLYNQIRYLNDNEISVPLIEEDKSGLKKYKILKVSNRYDEHTADFSLDYIKIKELALKKKKLDAVQKWMREKIESTYINVNKVYRSCNSKYNWLKK